MSRFFEEAIEMTDEFNKQHDLTPKNQTLMLQSEVGELSDEVLRRNPDLIAQELGDVLFVAYSIALLFDIDYEGAFYRTAVENSKKKGTKDGEKVSKEGLEDEDKE